MRKMLCEIDLEKAQGYPGRYLERFSTMNRAPACVPPGGTVS